MTQGEAIAASISPFLFSKHNATREELLPIISKQIDRAIENAITEELIQLRKEVADYKSIMKNIKSFL
jgi:hypothetical protein